MATQGRWFFSKEKLANTPSKKDCIDIKKELFYRQQAATLIQDMGQKLMVSQLCINSAIVYMHRFYMFHSFGKFHRNLMAPCCLFLACKVEEQPRKLEYLLKVGWSCIHKDGPQMDIKSERFKQLYDELVRNENILLATLGFDCSIDHPHTHVVKCCHLIKASRELAQTSYFMATNSLHLTMMCLEYRSTLVACVCIFLVYKWSGHEIPKSSKGKDWFWYVDREVTLEQLERVSEEFLLIFNQCPSKLKKKIMNSSRAISDQEAEQMKRQRSDAVRPRPSTSAAPAATPQSSSGGGVAPAGPSAPAAPTAAGPSAPTAAGSAPPAAASAACRSAPPPDHAASSCRPSHPVAHPAPAPVRPETHKIGLRAYKEKKEREHFEREKKAHSERERRAARPPPPKPEPGRPAGAGGDANRSRVDVLHKPSSVSDLRDLLKDVDGRHSLLHGVEHPAHRGTEPSRPPPSRTHPGHVRPHPSAMSDKPPHPRPGNAPAAVTPQNKHRPDGEQAHKPGHHHRRPPQTVPPIKQVKVEKPPPPPHPPIKQEPAPERSDLNGLVFPPMQKNPPAGMSGTSLVSSMRELIPPLGLDPSISPLSPLFPETSPNLDDVLEGKLLVPKKEQELPASVVKVEPLLSPLCFASPSPPKPQPAPVVVKTETFVVRTEPAAPALVAEPTKPRPAPLSPLKLASSGGGGGSIFSPPPRPGRHQSSDPELVLPKVDDIPMFSPLKAGTSSIKLPTELRSCSISSHDSDFEVADVRGRPTLAPAAASVPTQPPPPPAPQLTPTPPPQAAAPPQPPSQLTKVVSAPPSLLNAPVTHNPSALFGDSTARDDRHKHHKEKKKKKKEHKEHKHKKEKKHKEHKEKKKDKHRDREETSHLKITISKDKLGGTDSAPSLEAGVGNSIPKLTIRRGDGSPISSPGNSLKIRIGKDLRVTPADGFSSSSKKKRRRNSSESDPGNLILVHGQSSGSRHKHKHKRHREDSEHSDTLHF